MALEALLRVRKERVTTGDLNAPENHVYPCELCDGYHLSSTNLRNELALGITEPRTGESVEKYALRLEKRIAEQRSQILSLQALGSGSSNRESRKRIASLVFSLGRMTERWEDERKARIALNNRVKELEANLPPSWWKRLFRLNA